MSTDRSKAQVGQYYLMEKVAQGGMAEIFKGLSYDVHGLKKTVCIKKILPQLSADKEFIASLIDEAKLAVKLVHGNIAQTFDLGKVGDDYFMVMEFVDGRSLSQIHKKCLGRGTLIPIPCLVFFISELLNGLNYMHGRTDEHGMPLHIVHRDISPQNIMVSFAGTVKIIDFGIAKATFQAGTTDSGILKGKFAYMSPEQAYGDTIDNRSDLFSAGIILHEMLVGRRLFKADDTRQTIRNVRSCKVSPPSAFRGDIPEELDRIVMRALAKDKRHRYPLASDMHADLVKLLYTTYPDFKPSDAAAFVQELFRDEMGRPSEPEADARTPHLIIDRSNSALADDSQFEATGAARAPMDLGEYMLEETTAPRPQQGRRGDAGRDGAAEAEVEEGTPWPSSFEPEEETTPRGGRPLLRRVRRAALLGLAAMAAVAVVALVAARIARGPATPAAGTAPAELMVVTDPADATVSLNGRPVGQGSPVSIRALAPDTEHLLQVEKNGYTPYERRIRLDPGQFTSASVVLVRAASAAATIEVLSSPPGATVYLDDRETSHRTPATITGLETGREHVLGLFLAGHRFWTKAFELRPGETKSFDVNFAKDMGALFVDSSPPHALVMLDGVPIGQTPLSREDLEPNRVYKVEVWLEGHTLAAEEVKASAGRKAELRFTLTPEPKVSPAPGTRAKPPEDPKPAAPEAAAREGAPPAPAPKPGGLIEEPAPLVKPK